MRRADDGDVQSKRIVPPVIEGGGGDHHHAAPTCQKGAERTAESPDLNGSGFGCGIIAPRGGKDQIHAGERHQNAAELNSHVRRGPESVAPDAHVPGNVPVEAEDDGSYAEKAAPDVPGDGRAGFVLGGGVGDCRSCGLGH